MKLNPSTWRHGRPPNRVETVMGQGALLGHMDLNDSLQWFALLVTITLGALGLRLQHRAVQVAQEDVAIAREQLDLERQRHRSSTEAELRRIALEEQKLEERKAARKQRATGAVVRWMLKEA